MEDGHKEEGVLLRTTDNLHIGLRSRVLQAFKRLLEEQPLSDISVAAVCEHAGISRTTFYRLFKDKYDVFNWFLRLTFRTSIAQIGLVFPWQRGLLELLRPLDANRELARSFFESDKADAPRAAFEDYTERAIRRSVDKHMEGKEVPYRYRFQTIAFARAFSAAVMDWIVTDDPAYALVDNTLSIVPHDIFALLDVAPDGHDLDNDSIRESDSAVAINFVAEQVDTFF